MCFYLFAGEREHFYLNLADDVTRGALILHEGQLMWPPPPPKEVAVAPRPKQAPPKKEVKVLTAEDYRRITLRNALVYSGGFATVVGLGAVSPTAAFTQKLTTFGLAGMR